MPEIYIPFTHGQSEAVDAKLLPQGLFVSANDVRYLKDARLGARYGYRHDFSSPAQWPSKVIAAASVGPKEEVSIAARTSTTPAAYAIHSNGTYKYNPITSNLRSTAGSWFSVFEKQQSDQTTLASIRTWGATTCVTVGNVVYVAVSTGYSLISRIVDATSVVTVYRVEDGVVTHMRSLYTGGYSVKLLVLNGLLCVFWSETGASAVIDMQALILTTLAASGGTVAVVTAVGATQARYFDVAPGASSTEGLLVYPNAANTLRFGTVTSAGVFTQLSTIAGTNAELRPSICMTGLAPTDQVAIVWNDGATFATGNCKYTVYRRSTASFVIGTTTVDTSGRCSGYPVIGPDAVSDWYASFSVAAAAATVDYYMGVFKSGGAAAYSYGLRPVSKPFQAGAFPGMLVTDVDLSSNLGACYYALDLSANVSATIEYSAIGTEAVFAQFSARGADADLVASDPRRNVSAWVTNARGPGVAAIITALPVQLDASAGWSLYAADYGTYADTLATAAKLNGEVFFAGGQVRSYDGNTIVDNGYATPVLLAVVGSVGAGGIANGTYSIVVVHEWFDADGRRWRSAPSAPKSVTLAGANNTITVSTARPRGSSDRYINGGALTYNVRVYRTTLTSPTIYRDAIGLATTLPTSGGDVVLTSPDATVLTKEALYTQGSAGGLSGLLENDRPPAARFICAGSDRLMVGGLEDPTAIQWSKLVVPGEPMQWTDFDSFKATVGGAVTAVAEMDGTWFAFTADSVWTISGQGPDDSGSGAFDAPRRTPTDIGCISHRSLLLTGNGIIFQGGVDRMYILPRGGGAPTPIGWQVRATLAAYPFITASAFNQASNVAYWACIDTTGTTGRLLVFDTRLGEWYVDNACNGRAVKALSIYDGKLMIDGAIYETAGTYEDRDDLGNNTTVVPVVTMGDLRLFGLTGTGRLRKVQIEAEARDVVTAFTPMLDISYDSGKSFTEPVSWPIASLAAAIGDSIDGAEHLVKYPRGDTFRLRFSWTTPSPTEGIVWQGISLEAYPERGLKRQANSRRA